MPEVPATPTNLISIGVTGLRKAAFNKKLREDNTLPDPMEPKRKGKRNVRRHRRLAE